MLPVIIIHMSLVGHWSKEWTVGHRQSKEASILWSHNEETREFPGERDNARNSARCTQARKTTHGLDGQHQDVDRTLRGRVNQNQSISLLKAKGPNGHLHRSKRMAEDRDKWRKCVRGVASPRIENS